jgi:hypothetical protein
MGSKLGGKSNKGELWFRHRKKQAYANYTSFTERLLFRRNDSREKISGNKLFLN